MVAKIKQCEGCEQFPILRDGRLCIVCTYVALNPTKALPGSVDKITVMKLRAILEINLDHPYDRRLWEGQIWNFLQTADKIPTFIESLNVIGEEMP